eukprot:TRINITY_DN10403_c0_g1_i1.p1 TRINITY_DN10403_c0_g1~~TRINITY_DN10403_c0_g1_i1.p1  ORF type:complete len:345 (-),score=170.33 TRINITY_DN10403_c0_g1_i1:173-1105(-)
MLARGVVVSRATGSLVARAFSQTGFWKSATGTSLKEKLTYMRARTEAGVMDCKKALEQSNMDPDVALKMLSEKAKSATGKEGRVLKAASIALASREDGSGVAFVEGTSETDFVAKNELFQTLLTKLSHQSLLFPPSSKAVVSLDGVSSLTAVEVAELLDQKPADGEAESFKELVSKVIFSTGENIVIRRAAVLQATQIPSDPAKRVVVSGYTHGDGRVATAVALQSPTASLETLKSFGKDLAMHVAACSPKAIDRQHAEFLQLVGASGDDFLLSQSFIVDDSRTVTQALSKHNAKISSFLRWERGEILSA